MHFGVYPGNNPDLAERYQGVVWHSIFMMTKNHEKPNIQKQRTRLVLWWNNLTATAVLTSLLIITGSRAEASLGKNE